MKWWHARDGQTMAIKLWSILRNCSPKNIFPWMARRAIWLALRFLTELRWRTRQLDTCVCVCGTRGWGVGRFGLECERTSNGGIVVVQSGGDVESRDKEVGMRESYEAESNSNQRCWRCYDENSNGRVVAISRIKQVIKWARTEEMQCWLKSAHDARQQHVTQQ